MELTQEIKDALEKMLPAKMAEVVVERVQLVARLEKENASHVKQIERDNKKLDKMSAREQAVTARETELTEEKDKLVIAFDQLKVREDELHNDRHRIDVEQLKQTMLRAERDNMREIITEMLTGQPMMARTTTIQTNGETPKQGDQYGATERTREDSTTTTRPAREHE